MEATKRELEISAAMQTERFISFYKKTVISRLGDNGKESYLIRWTLFSCPWFSIKVHKILVSDDDCLHDHPWSYLSLILSGGYWEETPNLEKGLADAVSAAVNSDSEDTGIIARVSKRGRWYGPGSILWRPAPGSIHRLVLYEPAMTLIITFKRVQEWGFFTKAGWIPWFKYSPQNKCD